MRGLRPLIAAAVSLLVLELAVEIWLMLQNCSLAAMQASAPDEMLFIEASRHEPSWSFLAGYGPPFWLLFNAFFTNLPFDMAVPLARGFFIAMKYAAWLILFCILLKRDARTAVLFLLLLLLTPGYFFFGKIISPEYLLLLLSALCLGSLHLDRAAFGPAYLGALLFASLATATKVSAAPLLLAVYAAAFVHPWWAGQGARAALRNGLKGGGLLALFWLVMAWLCGPEKSWAQLSHALSIVPPTQVNSDVLRDAWSRDVMTWDQIMVGGLGTDFSAACLVSLTSLAMAVAWLRQSKGDARSLAWLALLSGGFMLLQAASHRSAYAWYVFLPVQLLAFGACLALASLGHRAGIMVCALIVLICFTAHDARRIEARVRHKAQNNAMVTSSMADMVALESLLSAEHPCARLGHADILVPSMSPYVMSMRTSLNHRSTGRWVEPDFLVLNPRSMVAPDHSGLAMLVELDAFKHFVLHREVGGLGLYIRRNLGC